MIESYKNKSILYMTSVDISKNNGPGVNEREFINYLAKIVNKNVHFIIPSPQFELPDEIPLELCIFTYQHNTRNIVKWLLHQISIIKCFHLIVAKQKFDYIVIRKGIFPFGYCYIAKKTKIPYVMKHAGNGKFNIFKEKNFAIKSLYFLNKKLFYYLLKKSKVADVVSESEKKSLLNIYGKNIKVEVVDNGVNINKFIPKSTQLAKHSLNLQKYFPIIGYAGNLPWERGAMQIIQALPELIESYPQIRSLILGDGDKMHILYDKAKELQVLEYCIFTGNVEYDKVVDYINCMDITVSIRYEDTQDASELKVRQYLACGRPVIVSPGSNDFVADEDVGFVVDPYSIDEFINASKKLLNLDKDTYSQLSERARLLAVNQLSYESKVIEKLKIWEKYTSN